MSGCGKMMTGSLIGKWRRQAGLTWLVPARSVAVTCLVLRSSFCLSTSTSPRFACKRLSCLLSVYSLSWDAG
ncbi:hypothetical protein PENSPDRAFT_1958 [Peniophora sp. CONT]|nr:hypothetical protein PENSPDRAFT_1958 [Peniophora sp. CONT]